MWSSGEKHTQREGRETRRTLNREKRRRRVQSHPRTFPLPSLTPLRSFLTFSVLRFSLAASALTLLFCSSLVSPFKSLFAASTIALLSFSKHSVRFVCCVRCVLEVTRSEAAEKWGEVRRWGRR